MMRERRFGGDIRVESPPRVTLQGGREYSPLRRGSRDLRTRSPTRASMQGRDYSRPRHELREMRSPFVPGSSSISSEMSKSRRVLGSINEDRHLDGDRDRQLWRPSQFNEGLSQKDSPSMKFQWKQLLDEPERLNGNANHSSKHFPDYGVTIGSTSGFEDMSHSVMIVGKPIPMEIERDRTFPAYPPESGTRRSSMDIDGGGLLLPSQKLNISLHKDKDLRFQSHLPADKLSADKQSSRELYKEEGIPKFYSREEKPLFYSSDISHNVIPSSQSKALTTAPFRGSMDDFHHSCGDGVPVRSDGFNRSSGMLTEHIACEAYTHFSHLKSSREPDLQLEDTPNYRQVQLSTNEGTHRGYTYPERRIREKREMGALSDKLYGKMASVQDDYGHQDSLGTRIVEPIMDRRVVAESSRREHLIEGRLWDRHRSSQEQPISNYLDAAGSSYASKKDGEGLGHRSMHLENEREVYPGHGNIYLREDHGYGRDAGSWSDEERLNMLLTTEYDPGLDGIDNNYQDGFIAEELGLLEQPEKMLKRKRDVDKKLSWQNPGSKFSSNRNIWGKIHHTKSNKSLLNANKKLSRQEPGIKFSSNRKISAKIHDTKSNKSLLIASRYRNAGRTFNEMVGHRNFNFDASGSLSVCNPWQLQSSVKDIKKRLGPVWPVRQHVHIQHPSVKKYKPHKFLRRNRDGYHGRIDAEDGGPLEGNLTPAKSEPPENSEDFKQLVHSAFLKFVKQLNENPGQRRRFKEQGKAGSLKCSVCGSDSEEFLDTESLVMHACTAPRLGSRAQHLGLHKALCSLMGWKNAEVLNSQWVHQVLADAETVALKEDLIIWPPVVVIHNSSIGNSNLDGRVIVSIEVLEAMLRDMGFGEKNKVCRGKPANQSIMVVRFSGTFSGLQEAERLEKFYVDSGHGRTEFQKINLNSPSSGDSERRKASANKVKNVLYGYLGIAEDLDKLDFETKKRCFVRSKKEIQDIADAPLKTERESNCS